MIKKIICTQFLLMFLCLTISGQTIERMLEVQLAMYPQMRLIDVYKTCFQDYRGAGHAIKDVDVARKMLQSELAAVDTLEMLRWYYEPCGLDSAFYRVSLRAVKDRAISQEQLLDCFVRSAQTAEKHTVKEWVTRWNTIAKVAAEKYADRFKNFDRDRLFIDSAITTHHEALSHSPEYRRAYGPHYRIVARSIFEKELKSILEPYQNADENEYIVRDGDTCPDFETTTIDGERIRMQDLRGKVVMLQLTASWCGVCRREMPHIEHDIWQRFKNHPDFVLIGIDRDEPEAKIRKLAQDTHVTYPLAFDPDGDIFALFALRSAGITRNILINREGRIIQRTRLFNPKEFQSLVSHIASELDGSHLQECGK